MRRFIKFVLLLAIVVSSCDNRDFDFIRDTRFLFSASLSDELLLLNSLHQVVVEIRLKEGIVEEPDYRLDIEIKNGTGILYQNGTPFESGNPVETDDLWEYQPTSLGEQNITLTLTDEIGANAMVNLPVVVVEFIPVPFNFSAEFKQDESFLQVNTDFTIDLETDDPEMAYVLNYEILKGEGVVKDKDGQAIAKDHPVTTGISNWKYFATKADENRIQLTIKDANGDEVSKDISIFISNRIPFTVSAVADPVTIRKNGESQIKVTISSAHPLFETLNFTMQYSSNFGNDALLLDQGGSIVSANTPLPVKRGDNSFLYQPVISGSHSLTFEVSDQSNNSETTDVGVNSAELQPPAAVAESRFELGEETCTPSGLGSINDCSAPLILVIDMDGSTDKDAHLGGFITDYRITIDDIQYTGVYNPDNPVVNIRNGVAKYTKIGNISGNKSYSDIKHQPNTPIVVELRDDDGLWSEKLGINVPANFPD